MLIVAGLREEYEAARDAALAGYAGNRGVGGWVERDRGTATPYLEGRYLMADGSQLSAALARSTRMGTTATAPIAASLVERLRPRCLAMCGVCAGNPDATSRGDVIVAELAYAYDEGRRTVDRFEGDHRQVPMPVTWLRAAQDLSPTDLPSFGAASPADATLWLLERLHAGTDPRSHPARSRYFPSDTWPERIAELLRAGLVVWSGTDLILTSVGLAYLQRAVYHDVQGPQRLPFDVLVGPMATGNVVVRDGVTWERLRAWGVRTVLGLDMEAAAIAATAHRLEVPGWAVAKGVMDHADPAKDDRYKQFAARASAEVLWKLLTGRLATDASVPSGPAGRSSAGLAAVAIAAGVAGPPPGLAGTVEVVHSLIRCRPGAVPVALDPVGATLIVADLVGISRLHLTSNAVLWELPIRWRSVASAGSRLLVAGQAQTLTLIGGADPRRRLDVATSVPVSTVALSPDLHLVAVGAAVPLDRRDAEIELRRTSDGLLLHRLDGLTATVRSITFSTDGQLVAACAEDGSARVWDTASGRATDEIPRTLNTRTLAVSRRKTLLALGTVQGMQLWDREKGSVIRKLDLSGAATYAAFTFNGALLVAGGPASGFRVWSTTTWRYHDQLIGPDAGTGSAVVGDDGLHLAVSGKDGTIRVWQPRHPTTTAPEQ